MASKADRHEHLKKLAQNLGIQPVLDVRIPAGGIGRRNLLAHHSPQPNNNGSSPETSTGRSSSRANTSSSYTTTSATDDDTTITPQRYSRTGFLSNDSSPAGNHDASAYDFQSNTSDGDSNSFLSTLEGMGGGNSERGALHKALALSRQDNRALRAQIERMRAREVEIVSLGVQSQMQMSSATQQLEGLKKRVKQELVHPIDEETYNELIGRNESELDLFNTIRIAIYQQLGELQASRDRANKELRDNAARYNDAKEFADKARYEMDQLVRQHEHETATLQDRIEILEARCKGLEQSAKTAALTLDANESKAARFDAVEAELKRVTSACSAATEERDRLNQKCSHLTSDLNQTRDELNRQNLLLNNAQTELKFQTREAERANARLSDRDAELRRVTEQLDELRNSRATSGSVIGLEREELRASYEKQLEAATKRMKEGFETDLARVREMSREASERECALLREARDASTSEINRMRQQYTALESEHATLKEHTREKLDNAEREIFELRIEVANLTNDGRRHDLTAQESSSEIQRLRTDRDCLQKKLDVLKQEFYDTRAAYQQQVTTLQSKVEAQEGQLEMFKSLETEAEVFMQHLAASESSNDVAGARALLDVPSSRRAAHTISVTKRCLSLENQVSLLKHEAGIAEIKHQKVVEELERARAALQDTNSPYLLLEKAFEQRSEENTRLRERLNICEQELSAAMKRAQLLAEDVHVLTAHRAEVLRLRDALKGLTTNNNNNNNSANNMSMSAVAVDQSNYTPVSPSSSRKEKKSKSSKKKNDDDENDDTENNAAAASSSSPQQQQQNAAADGFFEFHF